MKPDLRLAGEWVQCELSEGVRSRLLLHLEGSPIAVADRPAFVTFAAEVAHSVRGDQTLYSERKDQLQALEAAAKDLRMAIEKLSDSAKEAVAAAVMRCSHDESACSRLPEKVLQQTSNDPENLLDTGWDWVRSVELCAHQAFEDHQPFTRRDRPEEHAAHRFVLVLANELWLRTHSYPPKSKDSWLAGFAEAFGEHVKLKVGPGVFQSASKHFPTPKEEVSPPGS